MTGKAVNQRIARQWLITIIQRYIEMLTKCRFGSLWPATGYKDGQLAGRGARVGHVFCLHQMASE